MNKHNYLMALAMNANVGTLRLENATIPVKITEVESESSINASPMTTFKCLVVNDDQIAYHKRQTPPDYARYTADDVRMTIAAMKERTREALRFQIVKVIFNNPATIVIWADGTKTVVKCQEGDVYSKETGLALCFAKKALGNQGNFNEVFHKWIPEEEKAHEETVEGCEHCAHAKRTDEAFTVITPSGREIDAQFNWCPVCGKRLEEVEKDD